MPLHIDVAAALIQDAEGRYLITQRRRGSHLEGLWEFPGGKRDAGEELAMHGLWGEVEDRDIEAILNTYTDPRIAARELVRAAHHGGGKDNVTLVLVTIP